MAVYKASNCTPLLGSIDLTFGQIAQCEINSSNSTVTGYRLEILDNLNNVIFSGEQFSPVPQRLRVDCIDANATEYTNTGLNGSMLTVPLIIRGNGNIDQDININTDIFKAINATATGNSAGKASDLSLAQCANLIYYNNTNKKWYKIEVGVNGGVYSWKTTESEIPNLSNGYVNMPYKWRITLAQGQKTDTKEGTFEQHPEDPKWYDMEIAVNQQVFGSTVNRIQGPYSDKILSDYFIQLGTYSGGTFTPEGQRVIITSYDNYGYIYPRENYITEDTLDKSTHFQIYKETNEAKYVNSNRKVGYLSLLKIDRDLSGMDMTIDPKNGRFHYNLTSGYYEQIYNDASSEKVNSFNPTVQMYTGQQIGDGPISLIGGGTTILFAGNNPDKEQDENSWTNNPLNGIFVFADKVFDSNNNQMILRWQRPAMADSWAEYLDQIFYIENGTEIGIPKNDDATEIKNFAGQNIQCMADDMGVLNSSPLEFKEEEPIEIYLTADLDDAQSNNHDKVGRITTTVGAIAKNTEDCIYIRANNAVEAGQQFRYATSIENNYSYKTQIIEYVNKEMWYINPLEEISPVITPGTQYSIYSYFKGSDENPFYAYTTPEIKLNIENADDDKNNGDSILNQYTLTSYILNATGTFSQEQNKTWRSFQWILTNRTLNYSITGEKQYSGAIEYNFSGLQDLMEYSLQLIMEDEWGNTLGVTKYFEIDLGAEAYDYYPVTLTFDCDTQSVDIQFLRTGYIVPDPFSENDLVPTGDSPPSYQGLSYPKLSGGEASDYYLSIAGSQTWYDSYVVSGVKNYRDYGVLYQEIEVIDKRTNENGEVEEDISHIPLSGPSKDDFTLNLEVWQLSKLYEGNILVSYVYFNVNQFEDATRRLAVELSVPDVYIQTNEGTTVNTENLYKIWVRCWYENKSGPTGAWVIDEEEDRASSEVKFYGQDLDDSSTWLPSNKIPVLLFGKLEADTQENANKLADSLYQNADFYIADIVANIGTGDKQTHIINAINYIDNEQNSRPASAPYYNLLGDVNCHTPVSQSPEGITQGKDENENANSDIVNIELNSGNGEAAPFYGVIRFPLRERMDQVTGVVATSTGQERSNNYLKTPFFVKSKTTTGEYASMYVSTEPIETNTLAEGEVVEPTEENSNAGNNGSPKVALYVRDYSGMRNVWTDYLCRRAQQPDPNVEGGAFNRFFNIQDSACVYKWEDNALQTVEDAGNQHYIFKFKEDDEIQGDIVWYDTYADAPPLYRQWDVASTIASQQNRGARARINALGFIFNIVVQNINPDFSALGYRLTTKPRAYIYSTGNNTDKEENVDG